MRLHYISAGGIARIILRTEGIFAAPDVERRVADPPRSATPPLNGGQLARAAASAPGRRRRPRGEARPARGRRRSFRCRVVTGGHAARRGYGLVRSPTSREV